MQRGSHKIGKIVAKLLDLCTMQWWMVVVVGEGWGRGAKERFSSTCGSHTKNKPCSCVSTLHATTPQCVPG